jgi:predicted Zn-dependent protease
MKPRSFSLPVNVLIVATIVLLLVCMFVRFGHEPPGGSTAGPATPQEAGAGSVTISGPRPRQSVLHDRANPENTKTAQEIVAEKLAKFGSKRYRLVHAMAKRYEVEVPDEVERFFDAVEKGQWAEIDAAHAALLESQTNLNQPKSAELHQIWRAIQETWGAEREAHNWPAQTLLDYGNSILGSLRPGMIYAGGTDPGCFIPTMLNETSDAEQHIVLTQNALADGTYLKYLQFQYGDRIYVPNEQDSQQMFQEYIADAQKRLAHDQQFPDEPKQLKPGEDIKATDGRVQVSGQIAVMGINEKLFDLLMMKNPDQSFAMEESFPFSNLYSNSTTLGPVLEMNSKEDQNALTADRATQAVDYWLTAATQLLANPDTPADSDARKAYSKLISSQAGLLVDHQFTAQAEQEFQLAQKLCPSSPEVVFRYTNLLLNENRIEDALNLAQNAVNAAPDNKQFQGLLDQLKTRKGQ